VTGPELVDALCRVGVEGRAGLRLARLLIEEDLLARDLEYLDLEVAEERRETLRLLSTGEAPGAWSMALCHPQEMPPVEAREVALTASRAASRAVWAAAIRLVSAARALGVEVEPDDGTAEFVGLWATSLSGWEIEATLAEDGVDEAGG